MRLIEKVWFDNHSAKCWLVPLLLPLTALFFILSSIRRFAFGLGLFKSYSVSKPVIVVGNIGVGGNGKTPVVIHLVELAKTLGFKPGVISRGYGGKADIYPYSLSENSTTDQAGDEPVLIFKRCQVPVVVGSDRVVNAQKLIELGCDLIISDDGLQHYRLQRDLEIIVVDGKRLFGNGLLLPAGPLREGSWRLNSADIVIYNGECKTTDDDCQIKNKSSLMTLVATKLRHIQTDEEVSLTEFLSNNAKVNAIAGIGSPQRFFDTLQNLGFNLENQKGFVDHKNFTSNDFMPFKNDLPLLMTEKDAVKCQKFTQSNWWYLPVAAQFSEQDEQVLRQHIKQLAS
ncbi:MAG TPA: tetraacyldisaccharide 4'-kinase [Colwellia sp.]|nr:tetraacyldisaccharide 4'-kinase [Colwellia sp.]